jgi:hypothetical protein
LVERFDDVVGGQYQESASGPHRFMAYNTASAIAGAVLRAHGFSITTESMLNPSKRYSSRVA